MYKKVLSILILSGFFVVNFSTVAKAELPNLENKKIELPEVKLPEVKLPELNLPELDIETPQNFPDINIDLSVEYENIMTDLTERGLGSKNLNLSDKEMDFDWSTQGSKDKLSDKEFNSYLSDAKEKHLPKIEEMKKKSNLKYEKIDLSSKWDLMSFDEAKKSASSLPNYEVAKKELQAGKKTLTVPTVKKATLSYSAPSEFSQVKNKVLSNSGGGSSAGNLNLPSGITFSNGRYIDNRGKPTLGTNTADAVKDLVTFVPDVLDGLAKPKPATDEEMERVLKRNVLSRNYKSLMDNPLGEPRTN